MTSRSEVRYATPSLRQWGRTWVVDASPWATFVGTVTEYAVGWKAVTPSNHPIGLWPTKQAAAEVLVKQAGYEVGEV